MSTTKGGGTFKLYKSYSFRDKDPVIDRLRTIVHDSGKSYAGIEADSGVSASTLYNWFAGEVKRPQFATVMAVARALGYDMQIVKADAKPSAKIFVLETRRRAA